MGSVSDYSRQVVVIKGKKYTLVKYVVHDTPRQALFYTNGRRVQPDQKETELLSHLN